MDKILERWNKIKSNVGTVDDWNTKNVWLTAFGAVATLSVGASILFYADIRRHKNSDKPIGYRPIDHSKIEAITEKRKNVLKDRYSNRTKLPKNIEYIVIGSGMGGLSCAAALARCGRRVLVLEQHDRLGGCMHQFNKKYEFDVGIHYVGKAEKYGRWLAALSHEKNDPNLPRFVKLGTQSDGYTYDQYRLGKYVFNARAHTIFDDLRSQFNTEKDIAAIDTFEKLINTTDYAFLFAFLARLLPYPMAKVFHSIGRWLYRDTLWATDTETMLKSIFAHNPLLGLIVSGPTGDMGGLRKDLPFAVFCGIYTHYSKGGYYIEGGPSAITRYLINIIEKAGGRCLANAGVERILFDSKSNRTIGVELSNHKQSNGKSVQMFAAKGVVSAAGFRRTYTQLAPLQSINAPLPFKRNAQRLLDEVSPSMQHFQVFIGLNQSQSQLQLPTYNIWFILFPDTDTISTHFDYDTFVAEWHNDPLNAPLVGFVGFPSAKDANFEKRNPHKSSCVIVTEMPSLFFEKYAELPCGSRGKEYDSLKEKIGNRLIEGLVYNNFPQLRDCVDTIKYGSPLTAAHYLGSVCGESYGLHSSTDRYFDFDISRCLNPRQPIDGLYLAGQDTVSAGWSGAFCGGLAAAEAALGGYHNLSCMVSGRNLIKDLIKVSS